MDRAYYLKNKEKLQAQHKIWLANNKSRVNETRRKSYLINKEKILARNKAWVDRNEEKVKNAHNKWCAINKEKIKESKRSYYIQNRGTLMARSHERYNLKKSEILQQQKEFREKNPELMKERARKIYKKRGHIARAYKRQWAKINKDKINHINSMARARKRNATPPWLSDDQINEIKELYSMADALSTMHGIKYSVDHIYPLSGKTCTGLHVPWNLRVITLVENCKKNRSMPNEVNYADF